MFHSIITQKVDIETKLFSGRSWYLLSVRRINCWFATGPVVPPFSNYANILVSLWGMPLNIQYNPDNSNLQGTMKIVRVIGAIDNTNFWEKVKIVRVIESFLFFSYC